jgi:4-methyl-5(b-hydroxyethyl)-thiazole monophosphate biosynthesis
MPLVQGFEETEAVATIDILKRAGIEVVLAGDDQPHAVGAHDITIACDIEWDEQELHGPWNALVLPGGPGTPRLNDLKGLHALVRTMEKDGRIVAAICAAPTVLQRAGILESHPATCYPGCVSQMGSANLLDKDVVHHNNVITSRGVGTALDFGLMVAKALVGEQKAREVAMSIVYRGSAV